jgi:hypothetical protein
MINVDDNRCSAEGKNQQQNKIIFLTWAEFTWELSLNYMLIALVINTGNKFVTRFPEFVTKAEKMDITPKGKSPIKHLNGSMHTVDKPSWCSRCFAQESFPTDGILPIYNVFDS